VPAMVKSGANGKRHGIAHFLLKLRWTKPERPLRTWEAGNDTGQARVLRHLSGYPHHESSKFQYWLRSREAIADPTDCNSKFKHWNAVTGFVR
jgi:hypothetical protein